MEWVVEHGLHIFSRMRHSDFDHDGWTCQRASDKSLVQVNFLIGTMAFQTQDAWNDFALPIGLDHRCVPCILHFQCPRHKSDRRKGLNNLVPYLKRERETWFVSLRVAAAHVYVLTFFVRNFGNCFDGDRISRWELLQNLLQIPTFSNITETTAAVRQILKHAHYCHSRRTWTSMRLREHLQDSSMWKALRKMDHHTVRAFVQEPHPNEFAKMLEEMFSGIVTEPVKPHTFDKFDV